MAELRVFHVELSAAPGVYLVRQSNAHGTGHFNWGTALTEADANLVASVLTALGLANEELPARALHERENADG